VGFAVDWTSARSLLCGVHRGVAGWLHQRDPIRVLVEDLKIVAVHLLIGLETNLKVLRMAGALRTGVCGT
jgi:hypothetical protein